MPDVLVYIWIASLSFSFTLKCPDLEDKLYGHSSYGENEFIHGIFVNLGGELFAMAVSTYGLIVCIKPPEGFCFVLTWLEPLHSSHLFPESLPQTQHIAKLNGKNEEFVINKLVKWKPHKIDADHINICCSWCNKLDSPMLIILGLN